MIVLMELIEKAAEAIRSAEALLIGAGAGMGVDSGLPDFRGDRGFWRAYPPYEKLGLNFIDLANPDWFARDPQLGWGFYGHRLHLYRTTRPHRGFHILKKWGERMRGGSFVFTSNVDGQFQKAGYDPARIVEIHGSINWLQCMDSCGIGIFELDPANPRPVEVDEQTMRAAGSLPSCPKCGALARPNILMFGDWGWDERRTGEQQWLLNRWLQEIRNARLVAVECGSGQAISTVRSFCERVSAPNGILIRINPREPAVPAGHIGIAAGALETLEAIDKRLSAPDRTSP
jgi:NAD-dependent SIR2 family protein deacetylase